MLSVDGPVVRVLAPPERARRPARLYGVLTAVVGGFLGVYPLLLGVVVLAVPAVGALFDGGAAGPTARVALGIGFLASGGLFTAIGIFFFRAWWLLRRRARSPQPTHLFGFTPAGVTGPGGRTVDWARVLGGTVTWGPVGHGRPVTVGGRIGRSAGRAITSSAGLDGVVRSIELTVADGPPLRAALGPEIDDAGFRYLIDGVDHHLARYGRRLH